MIYPSTWLERQKTVCWIPSVACLGAYALPLAGILDGFVKDVASTGTSPILGSDRRTDLATAAFVHATLINALDFDDIYRKRPSGGDGDFCRVDSRSAYRIVPVQSYWPPSLPDMK